MNTSIALASSLLIQWLSLPLDKAVEDKEVLQPKQRSEKVDTERLLLMLKLKTAVQLLNALSMTMVYIMDKFRQVYLTPYHRLKTIKKTEEDLTSEHLHYRYLRTLKTAKTTTALQ